MTLDGQLALVSGCPLRSTRPGLPGIGLWLVDVTPHAAARAWTHLSAAERQRAQHFLRDADRHRFAVVRGALRGLLSRAIGVDLHALQFDYNAGGKPFLTDFPMLEFT